MVCRPPARKAGMRVTRKQRLCHPPAVQVEMVLPDGNRGGNREEGRGSSKTVAPSFFN